MIPPLAIGRSKQPKNGWHDWQMVLLRQECQKSIKDWYDISRMVGKPVAACKERWYDMRQKGWDKNPVNRVE